jgi:hypothetical protein
MEPGRRADLPDLAGQCHAPDLRRVGPFLPVRRREHDLIASLARGVLREQR